MQTERTGRSQELKSAKWHQRTRASEVELRSTQEGYMSTAKTLPPLRSGCRAHLSVAMTAKMELLRALVAECLSTAADGIFKIIERTIRECEEEMSCSQWVVDSQHRLSHSEDSLQKCPTNEQLPPATVNISVCWEEPDNSMPSPPTDNTDCPNTTGDHPHSSTDNDCSRLETSTDSEGDDTKQDLNAPQTILQVNEPYNCPSGLNGFSSKKMMFQHVKKQPEDKSSSYQCQFCDRYFCHKSEFIIHTRTHKGDKLFKCQDCEKSFAEGDSLFTHRQEHSEEKPYVCFSKTLGAEAESFRSATPVSRVKAEPGLREEESAVKTFPLSVTPYDESEFDQESLQPLCLYQIHTVADIDKELSAALTVDHIKTEAGANEPPSVTPGKQDREDKPAKRLAVQNILPRRPSGKSTELIAQFEAGTLKKPYKCPCCTKCFSLTKTLIRHIKIHTADKPYQCQLCGRNFCQKSDLVNHTRIHTGERPYQCQQCHKSFAQKGNLVVHMRKHTGEKPYQCLECCCSFSQKSSLHCHLQSHR